MCRKHDRRKMDECMMIPVKLLQTLGVRTCGSCCGHQIYPMTIVVRKGKQNIELFSGKVIPRKCKFYKEDSNGYFYIPETVKETKELNCSIMMGA